MNDSNLVMTSVPVLLFCACTQNLIETNSLVALGLHFMRRRPPCHIFYVQHSLRTCTSVYRYILSLSRFFLSLYIYLNAKSFATITKMLVPFYGPKQSLSDNAIDKPLYLSCIQRTNQNGVAYGCRSATIILRQPLILKSHGFNTSHVMRKNFFLPISVFKSRMEYKFKSG